MTFDTLNLLLKKRTMLENKKDDNQKVDFWDRLSDMVNRDILTETSGWGDVICENPWPESEKETCKREDKG